MGPRGLCAGEGGGVEKVSLLCAGWREAPPEGLQNPGGRLGPATALLGAAWQEGVTVRSKNPAQVAWHLSFFCRGAYLL